ncbi:FAD-binding protein [Polyangium sp. y55x31]|uniref:FAD-binding protein n=1 Tax=Polyangium sp. y55x31 TaxID=3042688 RepID=UPI0024832282|nr:FAD-binding protein [Polyangium sp. y55x31]MDI1480125.1 FAD-binding protein [Polyangium sp. y55x31]
MTQPQNRRTFLAGLTAATAILAFSPSARAWLPEPDAASDAVPLPCLDGQLLFAPGDLASAAEDFGHILHHTPIAVLLPGSIADIRALLRFAHAHRIPVGGMSMIGNTHSVYGQSQVEAGIVINMASLATIHEIDEDSALVDAGVRWVDLLAATTPLGKSPPALTDHIDLSIGGTLSVGGIGGQAFRHGMLVDNVLELEIITGQGRLVACSPTRHSDLFHAALGGIGQFGIIVRARVRLIDVPGMARRYTALYPALVDLMADQEKLMDDGRFDYLEGFALPAEGGGWMYQIEAVKYYAPGQPPDDAALTGDLTFAPSTLTVEDLTHFDFTNRIAPLVALLKSVGAWELPHPWIDMFVPGSEAASFIQSVLDQTTPDDMGGGPILIYPFQRAAVTAPFVALPDEPTVYLFSLLRFAPPPVVSNLLAKNRSIYETLRDLGGKRYAASGIPFTSSDWQDHFGDMWPIFVHLKHRFDPRRILTPGPAIFG